MWIRKSEEEFQKSEKKEIMNGFLFFACFIFTVGCIGFKIGLPSRSNPAGSDPLTWSELLDTMPFLLIFSIVFSSLIVFSGRKHARKTMICEQCFKTKFDDKNYQCSCSGRFVDIKRMKWVEEVI